MKWPTFIEDSALPASLIRAMIWWKWSLIRTRSLKWRRYSHHSSGGTSSKAENDDENYSMAFIISGSLIESLLQGKVIMLTIDWWLSLTTVSIMRHISSLHSLMQFELSDAISTMLDFYFLPISTMFVFLINRPFFDADDKFDYRHSRWSWSRARNLRINEAALLLCGFI